MRAGCHYLISLSVRLSVCVSFAVFTDCESCTRPISTNPASMEADEYGLTRGTCFITCRLEAVVVGGLLWLSWCVFGGADFFVFFFVAVLSLRTPRPAACEAALPHLPLYYLRVLP